MSLGMTPEERGPILWNPCREIDSYNAHGRRSSPVLIQWDDVTIMASIGSLSMGWHEVWIELKSTGLYTWEQIEALRSQEVRHGDLSFLIGIKIRPISFWTAVDMIDQGTDAILTSHLMWDLEHTGIFWNGCSKGHAAYKRVNDDAIREGLPWPHKTA